MMALPLLEAMVSSAKAAEKPRRAQAPAGDLHAQWHDDAELDAGGSRRELPISPILKPLEPYRDKISVFTGLAHVQAEALGDGAGDHGRCCGGFLTGVHVKKTEGADITSVLRWTRWSPASSASTQIAVAGIRAGAAQPGGKLRQRLQLRLYQHPGLDGPSHAAADHHQSA